MFTAAVSIYYHFTSLYTQKKIPQGFFHQKVIYLLTFNIEILQRDREGRKQMFRKVYMGTIYIILTHIIMLPTYKFADSEILEVRQVEFFFSYA